MHSELPGQLGHLKHEMVAFLWPVNALITWKRKGYNNFGICPQEK